MDNSFDNRQQALAGLGLIAAEMAHEVRTPIHVLKERLSLLLSTPARDIENEIQKMVSLCNHVLEITKTIQNIGKSSHSSTPIPTDISRIVHEAKDIFQNKFNEEKVQFRFQSSATKAIEVNRFQILQVLLNLFKNACEAMKDQNEKILLVEINDHDSFQNIVISDNGPGVSSQLREKLMSPFASSKTQDEGNGLGLYISKQIMVAHGGDLSCEATTTGAVFKLTIPLPEAIE